MLIEIKNFGKKLEIACEYKIAMQHGLNSAFRNMGGSWDKAGRVWKLPVEILNDIRKLLKSKQLLFKVIKQTAQQKSFKFEEKNANFDYGEEVKFTLSESSFIVITNSMVLIKDIANFQGH